MAVFSEFMPECNPLRQMRCKIVLFAPNKSLESAADPRDSEVELLANQIWELPKSPIIFMLRSTLSTINCLADSTYCLPNRLNKTAKLAITATAIPIPAPPQIVGVTTVTRSSLL